MADRRRRIDLGEEGAVGGAASAASSSSSGAATPCGGDGANPSTNPLNGKPYSKRYRDIYEQRKKLPVWQFLDQLDSLMKTNQVIVVEGETGSGKTTQVRSAALVTPPTHL